MEKTSWLYSKPSTSKHFFDNEEISERNSESIVVPEEASKTLLEAQNMDKTEFISEIEDFEDSGSDFEIEDCVSEDSEDGTDEEDCVQQKIPRKKKKTDSKEIDNSTTAAVQKALEEGTAKLSPIMGKTAREWEFMCKLSIRNITIAKYYFCRICLEEDSKIQM